MPNSNELATFAIPQKSIHIKSTSTAIMIVKVMRITTMNHQFIAIGSLIIACESKKY